jgi:hypothetical protein
VEDIWLSSLVFVRKILIGMWFKDEECVDVEKSELGCSLASRAEKGSAVTFPEAGKNK